MKVGAISAVRARARRATRGLLAGAPPYTVGVHQRAGQVEREEYTMSAANHETMDAQARMLGTP